MAVSNQTREEIKAKINRATVAGMFNGSFPLTKSDNLCCGRISMGELPLKTDKFNGVRGSASRFARAAVNSLELNQSPPPQPPQPPQPPPLPPSLPSLLPSLPPSLPLLAAAVGVSIWYKSAKAISAIRTVAPNNATASTSSESLLLAVFKGCKRFVKSLKMISP